MAQKTRFPSEIGSEHSNELESEDFNDVYINLVSEASSEPGSHGSSELDSDGPKEPNELSTVGGGERMDEGVI